MNKLQVQNFLWTLLHLNNFLIIALKKQSAAPFHNAILNYGPKGTVHLFLQKLPSTLRQYFHRLNIEHFIRRSPCILLAYRKIQNVSHENDEQSFARELEMCFSAKVLGIFWSFLALGSTTDTGYFDAFENIDDIDVSASGVFASHSNSTVDCGISCLVNKSHCAAFAVLGNDSCFHLAKSKSKKRRWSETAAKPQTLWIMRSALDPNCSKEKFPYHRGRSRYRIGNTKVTWKVAAANCESLDSKLAQITTESEKDFIWYNLSPNDSINLNSFVVGLKRDININPTNHTLGWTWHRSEDAFTEVKFWESRSPKKSGRFGGYAVTGINLISFEETSLNGFVCECFIF